MSGAAASHLRWTLVACILATGLAMVDGSVVNVALAAIGRDLSGGPADMQWTINAYMLPLSALLLTGGALGDRYGHRRILSLGIVVFTAASMACAVAPSLAVLLPARALQGVGAALLLPASLAILSAAFEGEARGRAVGTWAAAGAVAAAAGPPLGGWLVEVAGWRSIFFINLPIATAALFVTARFVRESGDGERPLDLGGAATATLGLGAIAWGLTRWSGGGAADGASIGAIGVGAASLAAFLAIERRRGDAAMMPFSLFASRAFAGLSALTLLLYGALGGLLVLLPWLLITRGGYSAFEAGAALLPFAGIVGLGSRLAGGLAGRLGPRPLLTVGPAIVAVGFALMTRADAGGSYWHDVLPGIVAIAVGMALSAAPLTTAVLSSVDTRHAGTASGFNSAISRTGGLIATALAGAVIGSSGAALTAAWATAAWLGAGAAAASSAIAFATLGKIQVAENQYDS